MLQGQCPLLLLLLLLFSSIRLRFLCPSNKVPICPRDLKFAKMPVSGRAGFGSGEPASIPASCLSLFLSLSCFSTFSRNSPFRRNFLLFIIISSPLWTIRSIRWYLERGETLEWKISCATVFSNREEGKNGSRGRERKAAKCKPVISCCTLRLNWNQVVL